MSSKEKSRTSGNDVTSLARTLPKSFKLNLAASKTDQHLSAFICDPRTAEEIDEARLSGRQGQSGTGKETRMVAFYTKPKK